MAVKVICSADRMEIIHEAGGRNYQNKDGVKSSKEGSPAGSAIDKGEYVAGAPARARVVEKYVVGFGEVSDLKGQGLLHRYPSPSGGAAGLPGSSHHAESGIASI